MRIATEPLFPFLPLEVRQYPGALVRRALRPRWILESESSSYAGPTSSPSKWILSLVVSLSRPVKAVTAYRKTSSRRVGQAAIDNHSHLYSDCAEQHILNRHVRLPL